MNELVVDLVVELDIKKAMSYSKAEARQARSNPLPRNIERDR